MARRHIFGGAVLRGRRATLARIAASAEGWLGRTAAACAVLACLALAVACVDDSPGAQGGDDPPPTADGGSGSGPSVVGSWVYEPQGTCQETLAFAADGRFVHSLALTESHVAADVGVAGRYTGSSAGDGNLTVQLQVAEATSEPALTYCSTWAAAAHPVWSTAALQAALGSNPTEFGFRSVYLGERGTAWIGTDSDHTDRLALVRVENTLHTFVLGGTPLFHRTPAVLPTTTLAAGTVRIVNLPQQTYDLTATQGSSGEILARVVLAVQTASDVTFAPVAGGDLPLCTAQAWSALDFSGTAQTPNPLSAVGGSSAVQVLLNPGDPGASFLAGQFPILGQLESHSLLPIVLVAPSQGACGVKIRARPAVERVVAGLLGNAAQTALERIPLAAGPAYLLAEALGQRSRPRLLPLTQGDAWPGWRIANALFQPPTSQADPLGLRSSGRSVRLSLGTQSDRPYVNVFSEQDGNLGPFLWRAPPTATTQITLPADPSFTLDANTQRQVLSLHLPAAGIVALETTGGANTVGALLGALGQRTAYARGGSSDGAGFRLVEALAAGDHTLVVTAAALPAAFTLRARVAVQIEAADAHLEACLRAALPIGGLPAQLQQADCAARGIASLEGIAAYGALHTLRLDRNAVSDLQPLLDLRGTLRVLTLADNPLGNLSVLSQMLKLHGLSLANTQLSSAQAAVLESLSDRLRNLDLRGVTGLSSGDMSALVSSLPNTRIVMPDGATVD